MSTGYIKDGKYLQTAGLGFGGGWCGMPDWGHAVNIGFVTKDAEQRYVAPADGYIVGSCLAYSQAGMTKAAYSYVNDVFVGATYHDFNSAKSADNVQVPVSKGDVFRITSCFVDLNWKGFWFVPFKAAAAGEGLSMDAVKQLRRLNYKSEKIDIDQNVINLISGASGAEKNGPRMSDIVSIRSGQNYYTRDGDYVQVHLSFNIAASALGAGKNYAYTYYDAFHVLGIPTPRPGFTTNGYVTSANTQHINGKAQRYPDVDRLDIGLYGPNEYVLLILFEYMTNDPIPGEEA